MFVVMSFGFLSKYVHNQLGLESGYLSWDLDILSRVRSSPRCLLIVASSFPTQLKWNLQ